MIALTLKFLTWLVGLLPNDPFQDTLRDFSSRVINYLGVLNYFVPFYLFVPILALWGVAMGGIWIQKNANSIMRWIDNTIKDIDFPSLLD